MKYEQKCHTLFAPCCDTLKCIDGVCNEEGKKFSDTDPVVIQKSCQEMRINHFFCLHFICESLQSQSRFAKWKDRDAPTRLLLVVMIWNVLTISARRKVRMIVLQIYIYICFTLQYIWNIVTFIYNIDFKPDECLLKCCYDHGMPTECLEEELETREVSRHNETHHTIRVVRSDKCHHYESMMQDCKKACIQGIICPRNISEVDISCIE